AQRARRSGAGTPGEPATVPGSVQGLLVKLRSEPRAAPLLRTETASRVTLPRPHIDLRSGRYRAPTGLPPVEMLGGIRHSLRQQRAWGATTSAPWSKPGAAVRRR